MAHTNDRAKQIAEAEEIMADRLGGAGFAKGLFFGQYLQDRLPRYPTEHHAPPTCELVDKLSSFCRDQVDPIAIDRRAEIPQSVIDGLGRLGILGACMPKSCGGMELTQTQYCRLLEVLGGHCASTALFVNAHHSIGPRSLVLFGTPEQQQQWLPELAAGRWISAFALTEPEAGSDAANVQTMATPTPDGKGYRLNGEKRWITNGGIAQMLTVMARTPMPGGGDTKITAFIVTPDMPGFTVTEKCMEKCGVRGTVTSRLAFRDMFVPRENILGELGKGLKVALTVLDFGRTTFGASCTGAAKACVQLAVHHARTRVQFGQPLAAFEMVQQKLAAMHAAAYAIEACTYQSAALIDSGAGEFMAETAMLKVFATELLWQIIYDTFQIYGGMAYFTDQPFERMMRDARINMIGEGANDVLRAFVALVGMRDVGMELESVLHAIFHPLGNLTRIGRFAGRKLSSLLVAPTVELRSPELDADAQRLGRTIGTLGAQVERLLRTHQREIVDRQLLLGRVGDAAIDTYACACVLNRLDCLLREQHASEQDQRHELETGRYFLATAQRRVRTRLRELWHNDDALTVSLARRIAGGTQPPPQSSSAQSAE